jgi:hypothetical protein
VVEVFGDQPALELSVGDLPLAQEEASGLDALWHAIHRGDAGEGAWRGADRAVLVDRLMASRSLSQPAHPFVWAH